MPLEDLSSSELLQVISTHALMLAVDELAQLHNRTTDEVMDYLLVAVSADLNLDLDLVKGVQK